MKKALCIKKDKDPFGYHFIKGKNYYYYTRERNYFVIKSESHCAFDKKHFNKYFIDLQEVRKEKLKKIENSR